jgi:hypothetical protein
VLDSGPSTCPKNARDLTHTKTINTKLEIVYNDQNYFFFFMDDLILMSLNMLVFNGLKLVSSRSLLKNSWKKYTLSYEL